MDTRIASGFYNLIEPEHGQERRHLLERIRSQLTRAIRPGMRVLDLGCGAGRYTFAIEELGAFSVGIDCAGKLLEYARDVAHAGGSTARFVQGDYCALPFARESFDAVLLIDNLVECSYDDTDRILRQLTTILTSGGLFCVSMGDHLARHQQGYSLAEFDALTGKKEAAYDPDGRGSVPYHAHFWTLPFARYVLSRHLRFREEESLSPGKHWLVYENG